MPIDDVAHRLRELGRLKFGEDLGDRPGQLKTWRLTSPNVELIEAAARLYGGRVDATLTGAELVTETDTLDILLPPQDLAAGQWFELWSAGGLTRRCTGSRLADLKHDGTWDDLGPCQCDPDHRECKIRTMLRVVLPDLPDLGVWRLSTGSAYAASELPAAVAAILTLNPDATLAPATLGLEERSSKKKGGPTKKYMVPVLRTRSTLTALIAAAGSGGLAAPPRPVAALETPPPAPPEAEGGPAVTPESNIAPQDAPDRRFPAPLDLGTRENPPRASGELVQAARALQAVNLAELPYGFEELITILDTLDSVLTTAGIWETGHVDATAEHHGLGDNWREGTSIARLRSMTIRLLLGANRDLDEKPHAHEARLLAKETR